MSVSDTPNTIKLKKKNFVNWPNLHHVKYLSVVIADGEIDFYFIIDIIFHSQTPRNSLLIL
jgi:hypothetical protein